MLALGNFVKVVGASASILDEDHLFGSAVADLFGRRWTHAGILLINAICFFILIWIVSYPFLTPLVTVLCMIVKFNISATFTVAYVQVKALN